jgi:hypothetical protein
MPFGYAAFKPASCQRRDDAPLEAPATGPGLLCDVFSGHLSGLQVVGCIVAISAVGDFVNARFIRKRKNRGS